MSESPNLSEHTATSSNSNDSSPVVVNGGPKAESAPQVLVTPPPIAPHVNDALPRFVTSDADDAVELLDVHDLPDPDHLSSVLPSPASPPPPLPIGTKRVQRVQQAAAREASDTDARGHKKRYTAVSIFSSLRSLVIVFAVSVIVATIFASFTSNDSLSRQAQQSLAIAQVTAEQIAAQPTDLPTPVWFKRIGILPGHSGINPTSHLPDPGALCPDGFNEAGVTLKVATMVIDALRGRGYTVDQLDEWDPRLVGYDSAVFLSIHADSCTNFNDGYPHSGFKVVNPAGRVTVRDQDLRLVDCLQNHYSQSTGLQFSGWTVTDNMLYYHAFHQITQRTPAAIIELGFLYYDRDLLQNHPDKSAQGITDGLLCFLDPKSLATSTPNVTATTLATTTKLVPSAVPATRSPTSLPRTLTATPHR
ncbi:MAG: N-acetylmuramoyl-L-alanine amidase family protein [Aggregatilineales bacterium]